MIENIGSTLTNMETPVSETNTKEMTYDEVMAGGDLANEPVAALSSRLASFRSWLLNEAGCSVHPSVCIVNGEATDGTKNAPVLTYGSPALGSGGASSNLASGRCGVIDKEGDRALYERTMGCQVRAARELKKGEIMCTIPKTSMITPDLVAKSDAGREWAKSGGSG